MQKSLRLFTFALILITLAASGLAVRLAALNAHALIGRKTNRPAQTPADLGLEFITVTVTAPDGVPLRGWYLPSRNRAAVILAHGFGDQRGEVLPAAALLARHGYGALLLDLRGHGDSGGEQVTFGLKEAADVRAELAYLQTRPDVDPGRIGALGHSLGAAVLLLAAADNPAIQAYWGDSPFASLTDIIDSGVQTMTGLPAFPFAPLIRYFAEQEAGFSAEAVAPARRAAAVAPRPIYLTLGEQDRLVPPASTRRLFEAAQAPKTLWADPAAGHVEISARQPAEYEQRLIGYFDHYLLGK